MKYIFLGTPSFARLVLSGLIEKNLPPALIVTNPDKPSGREKTLSPSPVAVLAGEKNISLLKPANSKELEMALKSTPADFFLVVAYGKILPASILKIPPKGILNIHPSLLPKHRGPTPIQSAILSGDQKTGATLMLLDDEVDHGPIISQKILEHCDIDKIKYAELENKLADLSVKLFSESIVSYLSGGLTPKIQNHNLATFTKKFNAADAFVKYEDLAASLSNSPEKAIEIDRKIRALQTEPGAWTIVKNPPVFNLPVGKRVKLLDSEIKNNLLKIKKVQIEGKKEHAL